MYHDAYFHVLFIIHFRSSFCLSFIYLHRYPRWGNEIETADGSISAPWGHQKFSVNAAADRTRTTSKDEAGRNFHSTQLSTSVQTLLQDFAADSEELSKSSSLLSFSNLPASSSTQHAIVTKTTNGHSNNYSRQETKEDSLSGTDVPPFKEKENESADADAGVIVPSMLVTTMSTSVADTLPTEADALQVLCGRNHAVYSRIADVKHCL